MSTYNATLNSGTWTDSGGNTGYRLVTSTSSVSTSTSSFYISTSGRHRVFSITVPWFGYLTDGTSNTTTSGTVTCTLNGGTFTGTISSSTFKASGNTTGSVVCKGTAYVYGKQNYTLSISGGGNLLKSGMRFCTNGSTVTASYYL